jgi:hypothetical protein
MAAEGCNRGETAEESGGGGSKCRAGAPGIEPESCDPKKADLKHAPRAPRHLLTNRSITLKVLVLVGRSCWCVKYSEAACKYVELGAFRSLMCVFFFPNCQVNSAQTELRRGS